MNKDKLILKDLTEITLETGASLSHLGVLSTDKASMVDTWNKLTQENLSEVQIKNGDDGLTVGNYTGLVLESETSTIQSDGSVLTYFNLREKTAMERQIEETAEQADQNTANIDYIAMETGVEV